MAGGSLRRKTGNRSYTHDAADEITSLNEPCHSRAGGCNVSPTEEDTGDRVQPWVFGGISRPYTKNKQVRKQIATMK